MAVIGDVHGCDRLLAALLGRLAGVGAERIVFVGDYIDRGEESAAVLDRLFALWQADAGRHIFLRGNHEEMMLRFLDDPAAHAVRWMRYGGLQTLASFGIGGIGETADEARALRARDALAAALGPEKLAWLRGLPCLDASGNVTVVHAGADPARPLAEQSESTLIWGHPDFENRPRRDGLWLVHGHKIRDRVTAEAGRIGVDTGAYATGRLSAAVIRRGSFEVIAAGAEVRFPMQASAARSR